jgi:hypothetical protein
MQKKVIDILPPKEIKPDLPVLAEERMEERMEEAPRVEINKSGGFKKGLLFTLVFLIVGVLFLQFVAANVKVEIWPETESLALEEKISVDSSAAKVDLASMVIPGKIFETEKSDSQQFTVSGKVQKEKYAQGTIRVFNNYSSSQTLVVNTRFQPPTEKVLYFRSTKTIVVPSKGYVDIGVKADKPGEEYNVEASTFSVPGLAGLPQYYSVYGKSFSAMTGGFNGEVSQVKQEDLDAAKKTMLDGLAEYAQASLTQQALPDFIFLPEAVSQKILQASSSVPAGTETSSFSFNASVQTSAISFAKSDLDDLVKQLINSRIKDSGKLLEEKSLKTDYSLEGTSTASGKIFLNLKISALIYSDLDKAALKNALSSKSLKESQVLLENQPGVVKAELKAFPFWLAKVPAKQGKISITLNTGY